ncbi:MAG: PEFG-CTERM sorting domain-containing protein [Thaumarchaeota archaeon]|nr:PEFG-CTERM sorting domain-containing protein [Nitrososphaerota archaeon]
MGIPDTYAVPEFPFAVPILLISIVSIIGFYRMKILKIKN